MSRDRTTQQSPEIYARASTEAKSKALDAVYDDVVTADLAEWNQDPRLLDCLASL